MMLRTIAMLGAFGLLLGACAGAQKQDVGGEVFCASYENRYLGDCRLKCENEATPGDVDALKQCSKYCDERLAEDDTFNDECKNK